MTNELRFRRAAEHRGLRVLEIGSFAEFSTHVLERLADDAVEFDVTTGMLAGTTPFRPHGHLVRLRLEGEATRRLAG
jgi:hypothetical protein